MSRSACRLTILAVMLLSALPARADQWVFMVYMFGHGDLECEALSSFQALGNSAGLDNIDIWIQLSRPHAHCADSENPYPEYTWTGIRRFHVTKYHPTPESGEHISGTPGSMNQPKTLRDFIETVKARATGENRHFVLVLWGHGSGLDVHMLLNATQFLEAKNPGECFARRVPPLTGYNPALSLCGIASAISDAKVALDVIAFDACVMGGVEMAYSFRALSKAVVASQEVVPKAGFDYQAWLHSVSPVANYTDVAKYAVLSYRDRYQNSVVSYPGPGIDLFTTLSAVDENKLLTFIECFQALVGQLTVLVKNESCAAKIDQARRRCLNFASNAGVRDQIDLDLFLTNIASSTLPNDVPASASRARDALRSSMIEVYRSHEDRDYGANGLSIYFPLPESSLVPGYVNPVINPFGNGTNWIQFLQAYRQYGGGSPSIKHLHSSGKKRH